MALVLAHPQNILPKLTGSQAPQTRNFQIGRFKDLPPHNKFFKEAASQAPDGEIVFFGRLTGAGWLDCFFRPPHRRCVVHESGCNKSVSSSMLFPQKEQRVYIPCPGISAQRGVRTLAISGKITTWNPFNDMIFEFGTTRRAKSSYKVPQNQCTARSPNLAFFCRRNSIGTPIICFRRKSRARLDVFT